MNPETIQRSRELAIHLDKDAYFPGETMSGLIYREAFINTRSAVVMVCIHGESKVLLESIGSAKKYYSCFVLARTCQKDPCILRRGPLRIWDGEGECWRFSFKIPFFADSTENEQTSSPSYTPVGATNHQVPPSYTLQKHGIVNACVEYYVCAKLLYPTGAGGTTWTKVVNSTHPFKLVQRSDVRPLPKNRAAQGCAYYSPAYFKLGVVGGEKLHGFRGGRFAEVQFLSYYTSSGDLDARWSKHSCTRVCARDVPAENVYHVRKTIMSPLVSLFRSGLQCPKEPISAVQHKVTKPSLPRAMGGWRMRVYSIWHSGATLLLQVG